ncbi:GyrI-like domain-containing protein [Dyella sp. C11]|uniref:GyrI-like domain-containing protein n=1 Tax=Dyella sp. C11 TaxID=2126991 RepID=UPI000D654320|nr:GyrI-like domain-containing protein [Dyella sp. C11]
MDHRIVSLPAFTVVGMEHIARTPNDIGPLWRRFLPREHEIGHRTETGVSYGVCTPQPDGMLRYVAGVAVAHDAAVPEGMVKFQVPAQKYGVFTHRDVVARVGETFRTIHTRLLPKLGLRAQAGVEFERYDERFIGPDDPTSETDIYIPVE